MGKAIAALCVAWALGSALAGAQTFTTLHSFDGTDGSRPEVGLVQATKDGDLYGTTQDGGANSDGTIFAISPSGKLTTLYSFCSQSGCTDGILPEGELVQATNGNLYGTTAAGGPGSACQSGCGTIFKIAPSGTLITLYTFCSQSDCTDGQVPEAGLIQAADGNFYGTTAFGGASACLGGGCGTIFKITPSGTLTTLHSFDGTDGEVPVAALVEATNGGFYGTTEGGGAEGDGTIFRISASGTFSMLHNFDGTDGTTPQGALVQAADGNLYGTTEGGGANGNGGTIFKITPSGMLKTLYSFCKQIECPDGEESLAPLIQATDGNFYGTTAGGGASNSGTIFKITPSGKLTTLYSFCSQSGCEDGESPDAALVQDTDGSFYGTANYGGAEDEGTVFSLSVGLGSFVETNPTSGKVGASVKILGTDLTGASSVTFNGTPATFVVGSANGITTTVPAGATTGPVQVVTPGGTLTSNVPFQVLP